MIFSDISSLNELISCQREQVYSTIPNFIGVQSNSTISSPPRDNRPRTIRKDGVGYHDVKDFAVDRWFNYSPPLTGNDMFMYHIEDILDESSNDPTKGQLVHGKDSDKRDNDENKDKSKKYQHLKIIGGNAEGDLFSLTTVEKIKPIDTEIIENKTSLLTEKLEALKLKGRIGKGGEGINLVIYIPQNVDALSVSVDKNTTVSQIIEIILQEHKERGGRPLLDYNNPKNYELRMHEGDGEPDLDFPAFDCNQDVASIFQKSQSNEFCLCERDEDNTSEDSDIIAMQANRNPNKYNSRAPPPLRHLDSASMSDENATKVDNDPSNGYFVSPNNKLSENSILITIPNAGVVGVNINDKTTLRDILPLLATRHRIRLYADEFSFQMSSDEQKRLNLMSPLVDMDIPIKTIGSSEFELQRKVYADASRITRPRNEKMFDISSPIAADNNKIVYNEITAAAYQEWFVLKKNKFGRRQERCIGIDGEKVYNSRRGHFATGSGGGVYRAQRDISSIQKVELVREDPQLKTLRITWAENRDVYDLEYACETQRDCNEIIAKLKYLLKRVQSYG